MEKGKERPKPKRKPVGKGRRRVVLSDDDEEEGVDKSNEETEKTGGEEEEEEDLDLPQAPTFEGDDPFGFNGINDWDLFGFDGNNFSGESAGEGNDCDFSEDEDEAEVDQLEGDI